MPKASEKKLTKHTPAAGKEYFTKEADHHPSLKAPLLFPVLIIFFSFAVYFNALFCDFVYDDMYQIVDNPWIRDIRNIPTIFSKSVWSFHPGLNTSNYYRPLMHILYMLNYHVFGLNPWGFHLVNILFHCGNSVLVFLIIRRLVTEQRASVSPAYFSPPFIATVLFALHPIHTEAVTWIAGLPDVAVTFFYLLSFHLYISFRDGAKRSYLLSILSFSVATLFKEPALTLPIILVAYDYLFKRFDKNILEGIKIYIPYVAVSGVYLLVRYYALGSVAPMDSYADLSTYQFIINVFPLFREYLANLLWPFNLDFWHTFHPVRSIFEAKEMISIAVTVIFFIVALAAYRKNKVNFFGLLLLVIPLLPAFYIQGINGKPFAERYLYLPSVGYVLLLAIFLSWAKEKIPLYRFTVIAPVIILTGLYSVQTIARNNEWKDNLSLFADTVSKSPDADHPHGMLGYALLNLGRLDEAIQQFRVALKLNPSDAFHHFNLGQTLIKKGLAGEAIPEIQQGLRLDPNNIRAHHDLASAYAKLGMTEEVMAECDKILAIDTNDIDAHDYLARAFMRAGQMDKAIDHLTVLLNLQPNSSYYHNMVGIVYGQKGLLDKAIEEFKIAVSLAPSEISYREKLDKAVELKDSTTKFRPVPDMTKRE